MKRSKTKLALCPSCSTPRHTTEMRTVLAILEKMERQEFKHYNQLKLDKHSYDSFIDSNFEWACDSCLEAKKALLASPGLQETPWTPHLAYSDTPLHCYSCDTDFVFTKEEKKAWYESYKLPINAQPEACLACRRQTKKLKTENQTVSMILKKEESEITDAELEQVVSIYVAWDKMERAKYYQSVLNKRNKLRRKRAKES